MAFLPIAALAVGAIGAGVSAAGAVEQGHATQNMDNYRAKVAQNNAVIANQNADYAINAGIAKGEKSSLKGRALEGRIKAAQAASGVDVNTGSATDVQESERETNKLDTETIMNNANLTAYGYRTQSTGFTAEAGLDKGAGNQAVEGADIGAAGSLLSNASSLGFKWATGGQGTP